MCSQPRVILAWELNDVKYERHDDQPSPKNIYIYSFPLARLWRTSATCIFILLWERVVIMERYHGNAIVNKGKVRAECFAA